MNVSYYIRNVVTGEIVPIHWRALESYHDSFVHYERPQGIIYWDEWDNWEQYKPTRAERTAIHNLEHNAKRLDYLRGEIQAERISYSEIAELQALASSIPDSDVELLQWAGVAEGER